MLHSDRFLAKGEINRRVKRRPKFTSGPRSVMAPVWNQTDFPWRFYYFLIACLRGRMNGSVLYETCMGFRLGMMTLYKIYIYIYYCLWIQRSFVHINPLLFYGDRSCFGWNYKLWKHCDFSMEKLKESSLRFIRYFYTKFLSFLFSSFLFFSFLFFFFLLINIINLVFKFLIYINFIFFHICNSFSNMRYVHN